MSIEELVHLSRQLKTTAEQLQQAQDVLKHSNKVMRTDLQHFGRHTLPQAVMARVDREARGFDPIQAVAPSMCFFLVFFFFFFFFFWGGGGGGLFFFFFFFFFFFLSRYIADIPEIT
jgi:hypothetical protein